MTEIIAHRGASAQFRENTVEAFAAAGELGADAVELDVRRTVDGHAAVHHDARLVDGRLICETRAGGLPSEVPSLAEALGACGELAVNVEIKNVRIDPDYDPHQSMAQVVVDTVRDADRIGVVIVSSFGFAAIGRVRELEPALRTAWLVMPSPRRTNRLIERIVAAGHSGIHPVWTMVDERLVDLAHRAGLFVNTWTVDDPDQMLRLADLGVDGIVTNVPDVADAALGRA